MITSFESRFELASKPQHRDFLQRVIEETRALGIAYRLQPIFSEELKTSALLGSSPRMVKATLDVFWQKWHTIATEDFASGGTERWRINLVYWEMVKHGAGGDLAY